MKFRGALFVFKALGLILVLSGAERVLSAPEVKTVVIPLRTSSATPEQILDKIQQVDGTGSGLDSDLLDGQEGSYYLDWRNQTNIPSGFTDNVDNDTLVGLSCSPDQLVAWNGSTWICVTKEPDTPAQVLDKVKQVDGTGSGLDSDLLDGQGGSYYLDWSNQTNIPSGFADNADNDTLAGLNCSPDQLVAWNGSTWVCVSHPPVCFQGDFLYCYGGSAGTMNVGTCAAGTRSCDQGVLSASCAGQVLPDQEVCFDELDNDCNGEVDNGCICDVGDCAACTQDNCASDACATPLNACGISQECLDFDTCYGNCTNASCILGCQSQYPTGSALWYEAINCLYCSACAVDCTAYCPIEPY